MEEQHRRGKARRARDPLGALGRDGRALTADPLHALARGRARARSSRTTTRSGAGRPRRSRSSGGRSGTTSRSMASGEDQRELEDPAPDVVLAERVMPGADWFPGTELNYAEHIFRGKADDEVALVYASELRELSELRWGELREQVAAVREGLRALGVTRGRPRRRLPAQRPGGGDRLPRRGQPRRNLVELLAGLRPRQRRRPLRPDRAEGAVLRRRLPLRRQGLRPPRHHRRDRRDRSRASSGSWSCPT